MNLHLSAQQRSAEAAALDTPVPLDEAIEREHREDIEQMEAMLHDVNARYDNFVDEVSTAFVKGPFVLAMKGVLDALDAIDKDGEIHKQIPGDTATARLLLRDALLQIFEAPFGHPGHENEDEANAREVLNDILHRFICFPAEGRRGWRSAP